MYELKIANEAATYVTETGVIGECRKSDIGLSRSFAV
jgi:hypothetical protein